MNLKTRTRLEAVEQAWADETNGELYLVPDNCDTDDLVEPDTVALVLAMWDSLVDFVFCVDAAQYDGEGNEIIPDDTPFTSVLPEREIARRIAVALAGIWYGGKA
jgi:hypothetical protein